TNDRSTSSRSFFSSGILAISAGGDVLLHVGEHRVLVWLGKFGEGRAFGGLGVGIDGGEPRGIGAARAPQRASERTVDVMRCARLSGARAVRIGWDQTCDDRFKRVGLGGGQRFQCFEPGCLRPWRLKRGSCGGRRRLPRRAHHPRGRCRNCRPPPPPPPPPAQLSPRTPPPRPP